MSTGFTTYTLRRIFLAIPTVLCIILVTFLLVNLAPGDPVDILAGGSGATPEYYTMMRKKLGLDRPLWVRISTYFTEIARGNLGYSMIYREPVIKIIFDRAPATILLGLTAITIATFGGILIGAVQASWPNTIWDFIGMLLAVIGYSIPLFWLGQILILVFAVNLNWLPISGMHQLRTNLSGIPALLDTFRHLVLPAITLSMYHLALIARLTRSSLSEVIGKDYITTAISKGLSTKSVLLKHALRNALMPVLTATGMNVGFMFAGSVLTETVFGWPGVGRLMYQALLQRDYSLLSGIFLMVAITIVIANLLTDIAYSVLDPRIRLD
ncbi:MAG: ABC transporter permease [Candidatus Hodarchaeota archaeon]